MEMNDFATYQLIKRYSNIHIWLFFLVMRCAGENGNAESVNEFSWNIIGIAFNNFVIHFEIIFILSDSLKSKLN